MTVANEYANLLLKKSFIIIIDVEELLLLNFFVWKQ